MIVIATLVLALTGGTSRVSPSLPADNDASRLSAPDTLPEAVVDTVREAQTTAVSGNPVRLTLLRTPTDTPRARPRAVEMSDWYERRLRIHRYLSYTAVPMFALQYAAGQQLFDKGSSAPGWAKTTHRVGATTVAGIFTVNTVTGVWNLWDSRHVKERRALRYTHAIMMLAADAGFTYAGVKLANDAETSLAKRREHRTVALASIGVSTVGGLLMYFGNR